VSQPVALYRKYRSKSFDELIGQDHITTTLKNALKKGSISHAYLFTGPHGVGKTSTARIFAHAINDIEFQDEGTQYLDIIEIDAASNRRIEEIRNLRETIHVAPSQLKYKVYIIDEVHMLTKEAFNALLKTLEEPPAHAVFILATTEAHKLPATIISRTQRHSFKPINTKEAIEHIHAVAKQEDITIDSEAAQIVAEQGKGSFRDILSLLDQAAHSSGKNINKQSILDMLGLLAVESIQQLVDAIEANDTHAAFSVLEDFYEQGTTAQSVAAQLIQYWRQQMRSQPASVNPAAVDAMMKVQISHSPEIALELAMVNLTIDTPVRSAPAVSQQPRPSPQPTKPAPSIVRSKTKTPPTTKPKPAGDQPEPSTQAAKSKTLPSQPLESYDIDLATDWPRVIEKARNKSHSLFSSLRQSTASMQDNILVLAFRFPLHLKKVRQSSVSKDFEAVLTEVFGGLVPYETVLADKKIPSQKTSQKEDRPASLKKVTDILGGDVIELGA